MSPIQASEYMTFANDTFTRLSDLRHPTIAVINGYALGGGMNNTFNRYPYWIQKKQWLALEVGLGIIPGFAGTQRMSRLMELAVPKNIFTTRTVKGQENLTGILNKLVPAGELLSSAEEMTIS